MVVALLVAAGCGGEAPTARATPATEAAAPTAAPATGVASEPADVEAAAPAPPTAEVPAPAPPTTDAPDEDRRRVPEVRFRYFDGSAGTLADFAGTPTVINFWASWCPPCITEMPAFEAVHIELAPDVAFLGINVGDELAAARRLAERTGVTYPLAEDPDSGIFQSFGGIGMPTTVFVDAEGMIVHMISSRLRAQDLRGLISEHLGV